MNLFDSRYEILEKLGEGGNAAAYLACDHPSGKLVVLKRLLPGGRRDSLRLHYFHQEFEILSRLDVPGVPKAHRMGEWDGLPYFALDYIPGKTFADHLAAIHTNWKEACRWLVKVAQALERLHAVGVVHGDVKPDNILVDPEGKVWLIDFGVSSVAGRSTLPEESEVIIGTPTYLAPELVFSGCEARTPRSDVYALGVILYDLLTGRLPFDGQTEAEILSRIETENPRPPHEVSPGIPTAVSGVAVRALEKSPSARFRSAGEFARALEASLDSPSEEKRAA